MVADSQLFNYFQDMVLPELKRMESLVLNQVLTEYLHRKPREKDAKKCCKLYSNTDPMNYDLSYKDQVLGRIVFDVQFPEFKVTFKPK